MKFSICIPTWEQYGRGVEFLKNNFEVLLSQTYKNFNVIIVHFPFFPILFKPIH